MREIRPSGSEGGVEFKPPSLPLFYSPTGSPFIVLVTLASHRFDGWWLEKVGLRVWTLPQGRA
jgi:hypothetical protein